MCDYNLRFLSFDILGHKMSNSAEKPSFSAAFAAIEAEEVDESGGGIGFQRIKTEILEEESQISIVYEKNQNSNNNSEIIVNRTKNVVDFDQNDQGVYGNLQQPTDDDREILQPEEISATKTTTTTPTKQKRARKDDLSTIDSADQQQSFMSVSELLAKALKWGEKVTSDPNRLKMIEKSSTDLIKKLQPNRKPPDQPQKSISNIGESSSSSGPATSTASTASIFDQQTSRFSMKNRVSILSKRPDQNRSISILSRSTMAKNGNSTAAAELLPFRCSLCPAQFAQKEQFDAHLKYSHDDDLAVISNAVSKSNPDTEGENLIMPS